MSSTFFSNADTMARPTPASRAAPSPADQAWRGIAIALLSVRFIQGFVYWGGGSRRFIYAPSKLNPHSATWLANKFHSAMPGALLGMDHVVAFLLHHFWLFYPAAILFSAAELVAGLFLMAGFMTRASAAVSVGFSVILMLLFGWQGASCIDEWTMAACNLGMGATLALAGSGAYSLDNVLLRRHPVLADRPWFRWLGGSLPLPLSETGFRNLGLAVLAATALFNVATYDHYRGSVYSAFHGGPVSPTKHHISLDNARLLPDGGVSVHAYLDAGTPEAPSHVVDAALLGPDGAVVRDWDMSVLSHLPRGAISNDFDYNTFKTAAYGLTAEMGAMATITLPGSGAIQATKVRFTTVSGHTFEAPIAKR